MLRILRAACVLVGLPVPAGAAEVEPASTSNRLSAGLGAVAGDPTGANVKLFFHPRHALQSSVGFAPIHLGAGRIDASYLFHSKPWGQGDAMHVLGYLGAGVGMAFWSPTIGHLGPWGPEPDDFDQVAFFFRAPVLGISFNLHKLPLDIFVEGAYSPLVGPPITWWNFDFCLGVRYWFGVA